MATRALPVRPPEVLLDAGAYAHWLARRFAEMLAPPIDHSGDFDIDPLHGW
jgi:hypothetical protein